MDYMEYIGILPQGMITQSGNILRVDNALVEEVFTNNNDNQTGYVLISYGVEDQNDMIRIDILRLNVGKDTIIINEFGETICLCELRREMRIDAEFSSAMTRSIPPQSRAYRIMVRTEELSINVTTDRVVSVDIGNSFFLTGNPYDMNDQIRFSVGDATILLHQ